MCRGGEEGQERGSRVETGEDSGEGQRPRPEPRPEGQVPRAVSRAKSGWDRGRVPMMVHRSPASFLVCAQLELEAHGQGGTV